MNAFATVLRRDLLLAVRSKAEVLQPLFFLLVVVSLFPLGLGPGPVLLARIAAGVILIAALLASTLSLDSLFRGDYDDGSLDLMLSSGHSPGLLALAKICAHWLTSGLPIVLFSPLLAIWLNLPPEALPVLLKSLLLGTPIFSLIGAIGAALTVGLRQGGQLMALLVFPLLIPVLILATGAVSAATAGMETDGYLLWMAAYAVLMLTLAPFACAAALKISLS